jgi:flagella synthesis protein FlgN
VKELQSHLIAVLGEQIRCAEEMLGVLGRERQALIEGNPESLNAAGAQKARLVETLETLEAQRRTCADTISAGFANERPSVEPQWQSLLTVIAACKEQNQRNGALLKARADQVRTALKVLRGAEPEIYAASGHTPSSSSARSLGSA